MAGSFGNISAYLSPGDPLIPGLENILRVRPPNYWFSPAYQNWKRKMQGLPVSGRIWDGWERFYSKRKTGFYFPTGFLFSPALKHLRSYFQDVRKNDGSYSDIKVFGIQLRDYQLEAARKALENQRGIIAAATNAGKTEIAAAIISAVKKPAIFIVHRSNLALQTRDRFRERLRLEVDLFGAGGKDFGPVTVATIQSLYSVLKKGKLPELDLFEVVFVDEAHHEASSQYMYVLKRMPNAFWRFGLTGTPHRDKNDPKWWKFVASTGGILFEIKNQQLIEMGVSAKAKIYFYEFKHSDADYYSWQEVYRHLVEENLERNLLIKQLVEDSEPGVLVAVRTIRHGKQLQNLIRNSVLLTGEDSVEKRKQELKKLVEGKNKIIIATTWFYEGMDVPEIKTLVNASGGLSDIELLQKLGRGLRKKSDDSDLVFIDIYDKNNKYLEKHSAVRLQILEKEGLDVSVVRNIGGQDG